MLEWLGVSWQDIGIWLAALLTLCIYSFLYRDNPFYRFAEHLFVGVSVGYGIALTIHQGFFPFAWNPLREAVIKQEWIGLWRLVPIGIGVLFFARLIPTYAWLIRYPIAILMGIWSGLAIPNVMQADIFQQILGTLTPFGQIHAGELDLFQIFGVILMLVGVISTLTYFFFSVEHRGVVGGVSKIGIVFLMIGFGSAFGNTVMGRVSLLIQRVDFLLADWLHLI